MDLNKRASVSQKARNINLVIISIVGSISVLGFVMAIYSLVKLEIIFSIVYLLAVLLGFSYVVMKINTIMPIYIERNDDLICIQNWVNGLFPFVPDRGIIGEFTPSKSMLKKIDVNSISKIYIGSRSYLLKVVKEGDFTKTIDEFKEKYDNILKHMDILYIKTIDESEVFLSVTDFDDDGLIDIFKPIIEENDKIDFKCSNRYISKAIPTKKFTL